MSRAFKKATIPITLWLLFFSMLQAVASTPPSDIQRQADSLRAILNTKQGEERTQVLRSIFKLYYANSQVEPAYAVLDEIIELEQQLKHPENEASARWNKIALLNNNGRFDSLYVEAGRQMEWYKKQQMWDRYYQAWQRKCSASHDLGLMQTALREAKAMQEDAFKKNNNIGRAMAYKQMGIIYFDIHELTQATDAFERSVALLIEEHDSTGMISGVYEGLCQALDKRGLYDEELAVANSWAEHMRSLISLHNITNVSPTLVTSYMAHAAAYIGQKKYAEARSAIKIAESYQAKGNSVLSLYYLFEMYARLAMAEGRTADAISYSDSALSLNLTVDDKIYELRAAAFTKAGRYDEAAEQYRMLYNRKDTLYTHVLQSQMDEQRAMLQLDEMERKQRETRILSSYIIGGSIIAILVAFLLYRRYQNRKLKRLNEELQNANNKAEESSRMKSEFIKNISHEIRTPLNVLNGFTQIMMSPGIEMDQTTKNNIRERIRENTDRMTELVNKMLELSDANSQAVIEQHDQVSPSATAAQAAINAHMDSYKNLKFNLKVDHEANQLHMVTNQKQVTRVLTLLLDNAVKFTAKGDITIHVSYDPKAQVLQYAVEDTGIGVPASEAEHIFEEFVQLDEYVDGTGIGLTVARNIARRLSGDLYLDTSYTGGARFVFSLPVGQ